MTQTDQSKGPVRADEVEVELAETRAGDGATTMGARESGAPGPIRGRESNNNSSLPPPVTTTDAEGWVVASPPESHLSSSNNTKRLEQRRSKEKRRVEFLLERTSTIPELPDKKTTPNTSRLSLVQPSSMLSLVPTETPEQKVTREAKALRAHVGHPREETTQITYTFRIFFMITMMINYDSGAIPAVLDIIEDQLDLTNSMLGALPYIGIFVSSLFCGWMLTELSQKEILIIALICNVGFTALLALGGSFTPMAVARFGTGLTQGPFVIYSTVWVEEFAPVPKKTTWMGLMQIGTPVGVMFGYTVSGLMVTYAGDSTWPWALLIQCFILAILIIVLVFIPYRYIDNPWTSPRTEKWRAAFKEQNELKERQKKRGPISLRRKKNDGRSSSKASAISNNNQGPTSGSGLAGLSTGSAVSNNGFCPPNNDLNNNDNNGQQHNNGPQQLNGQQGGQSQQEGFSKIWRRRLRNAWRELRHLFKNPIFVIAVLTLSVLYFVVTGIQFWATKYLLDFRPPDKDETEFRTTVLFTFAFCALTGPALGVIMGGLLVDKAGGYNGLFQRIKTLKIDLIFAGLASICGIGGSFLRGGNSMDPFWGFCTLLWLLLFFGGAMVPSFTGIMISAVALKRRALASSCGQATFNILGFALGSFLPGQFGSWKLGFRVLLYWSGLGLILIGSLLLQQRWKLKKEKLWVRRQLRLLREFDLAKLILQNTLLKDKAHSSEISSSDLLTPEQTPERPRRERPRNSSSTETERKSAQMLALLNKSGSSWGSEKENFSNREEDGFQRVYDEALQIGEKMNRALLKARQLDMRATNQDFDPVSEKLHDINVFLRQHAPPSPGAAYQYGGQSLEQRSSSSQDNYHRATNETKRRSDESVILMRRASQEDGTKDSPVLSTILVEAHSRSPKERNQAADSWILSKDLESVKRDTEQPQESPPESSDDIIAEIDLNKSSSEEQHINPNRITIDFTDGDDGDSPGSPGDRDDGDDPDRRRDPTFAPPPRPGFHGPSAQGGAPSNRPPPPRPGAFQSRAMGLARDDSATESS